MSWSILTSPVEHETDVVAVRQRARRIAELVGFDRRDQTRIATAVSEIARNAVLYARGGRAEFLIEGRSPPQLFLVRVRDQGPGIAHLETVLAGDYHSQTGLGRGLVGARRLMDHFEVDTRLGGGTTIELGRVLPRNAATVTAGTISRIGDLLVREQVSDPLATLREQNRELLASLTEVQERRAELHESEQRYRALTEAIASIVWITAPDGRVEDMPQWRAATGQDVAAVRGWGWLDALHPDDRRRAERAWRSAVEAGAPYGVEYRIATWDGVYRWHEARGVPVRGEDGAVREWVGVCIDIDQRRRAEDALRELNALLEKRVAERTARLEASEARAMRLYNRSPVPQHSVDAEGRHVAVSDGWCELMGYAREEAIGQPLFEFVAPAWRERLQAAWRELSEQGEIRDFECELTAKDGTPRPVLVSSRIERDGQGRWVRTYGALVDLRARKVTEAALAREAAERAAAEEALRQAQKMQALGQLTGGIAHDFNNLLMVIQTGIDFLKRKTLTPERYALYLDAIDDAAARAGRLTHQLLAFARKQPLKPEIFDLNDRLRDMTEMLRRTLGSRYRVACDLAPDLGVIEADPTQLEIALLNIGINARDAMPDGGSLTIETRVVTLAAEGDRPAGEFIRLRVTDTGNGIPPEVLGHVFEPFFTTKAVGKGTGLGLSQVHGFVAQTGGDVRIESQVGVGTTVVLHLPRPETKAAAAAAPIAIAAHAADSAERVCDGEVILLVEDNPQVGEFAQALLEEFGCTIIRVETADAAIAVFESGAKIDLVFSDIVMPGRSGLDLVREIRERRPGLPVILTTGYSDVAAREGSNGAPVLVKPYRPDDLAAAVRQALSVGIRSSDVSEPSGAG